MAQVHFTTWLRELVPNGPLPPSGATVGAAPLADRPVTAVLADARDGARYAALKHGHFGPKLHRSDDQGRTWRELATPAFPDAAGAPALNQIWTIEAPAREQAGRLWVGG